MKFIKWIFEKRIRKSEAIKFAYWCMHSGKCWQSCSENDYERYLLDRARWEKSVMHKMRNIIHNDN